MSGERRLFVVKVGGDLLRGDAIGPVVADVAALVSRGDRVVMVHGGGPQATALQRRLGQSPNVVAGRRITDADALDVMKMVVGGRLNIDLCAALLAAEARPVGLHGASALAIEGRKRPPRVVSGGGPEPIDFGHVGDIVGFNRDLLARLLDGGYVPVLSCLAADASGAVLNVNADIVANDAALALGADGLVLVTNAPGVLRDRDDPTTRIPRLDAAAARAAIADGSIVAGMIPKIEESLRLLAAGRVAHVHIVGQLARGDLLWALDSPGAVGTVLTRGRPVADYSESRARRRRAKR